MFEQIKLPYAFDALEPYIDTLTMETHYGKHYATYTKNFNDFTTKAGINDLPAEAILADWKAKYSNIPEAQGIRNNGGGYYNHSIYFAHLSPNGGEPTGELASAISSTFGSFSDFKETISKTALGVFGSGWAWLNSDSEGKLCISTSPNQDNPILETEGKIYPIFAIDVWEHAYYLKHLNVRADYIKDFFNVINWNQVAENYTKAKNR